jgi:hypothetical protein
MKKIVGIVFVICAGTLGSCWYDHKWEQLHPNGQSSGPSAAPCTFDTTATVSYSVTIQPIITQNCATTSTCHINHGGALNYNVFSNVVADAQGAAPNDILTRINLPTSNISHMPQNSGFLATCDITKIRTWIKQGCQNN